MSRYVEDAPGAREYWGGWRPHMERRAGETSAQHNRRLFHSCYRCGHYEDDETVLDEHEDGCKATSSLLRVRS